MAEPAPQSYEIRPDPSISTNNPNADGYKNVTKGEVDYTPHPEAQKIKLSPERQHIVDSITRLYSGSSSKEDMEVYAHSAVYDDPWSYCDTRYKIAGQWYGISKAFWRSQTMATEVVQDEEDRIVYKQQQEYTLVKGVGKKVDSLVTLTIDGDGKVKYHKDMWNEKDYSHGGLGKVMKTLNGDHLTKITRPEKDL